MRILIAPDSFKGSLSAADVAECISRGIKKAHTDEIIDCVPMTDGGEGLVDTLVKSCNGRYKEVLVKDPLMRDIGARIGLLGDTAIVEMAAASGIELLKANELNPLKTTTYGTGQLIKAALDSGCKKIIIGLGGSATNDGGAGMAQALGARLLDENGEDINHGGGELFSLHKMDISNLDPRLKECEITGACDVINPLIGENGASKVYGPQKGASAQDVERLDSNLEHYSNIIKNDLGLDVRDVPGSGAAGGFGAGILAFLNAKLEKGFDIVSAMVDLETKIVNADIIITGEGRVDGQSVSGKVVSGIGMLAKKHNKLLIVIAGSIGEGAEKCYEVGVTSIFSIINRPMTLEEARNNSEYLIEQCAFNVYNLISMK